MKDKKEKSLRKLELTVFILIFHLIFTYPVGSSVTSTDHSSIQTVENNTQKAPKLELKQKDIYQAELHQNLECSRCHKEETVEGIQSDDSVYDDSIDLCMKCHPVEHLHPVGITLKQGMMRDEKDFLPLGQGIRHNQIVCPTCHAIHQNDHNPHLLRGEKASYNTVRNSLCSFCHSNRFYGQSPHSEEKADCRFCHVARPTKDDLSALPPDILLQASCSFCHPNLTVSHFAGINPFEDTSIRKRAVEAGNVFVDGQEVCTTCHEHHIKGSGKYLLRRDYLSFCMDSRSLNPHWNDFLCMGCHRGDPVKGNAMLREEGDINEICNRCHLAQYARADIHPVGIVPSIHVRVPAEMPLQGEKLTCETCHETCLQMDKHNKDSLRKTNANFLRMKKMSRNELCFLCHVEETYKRLNPHKQMNEQGQIKEETCLFCHASIPDVQMMGPEKVTFIVYNPDEYCIGCHRGFSMNHPAGVKHLITPSDKIMAAIRTAPKRIGVELPLYKGRIVCATCHNPHEEGVIKIAAAATGAKRENKLRLMPGRTQCTGCHWDK